MFITAPLTGDEHAVCLLLGAGSLVVSALLKLTPTEWVDKIPVKVNEDIDNKESMMEGLKKMATRRKNEE